jgi:multiple sugar transport system permease protein
MLKRLQTKNYGILTSADYKKPIFKIVYWVILFLLFVAVLTALTPVLWLFITSFKDADELTSVPYKLFPEHFSLSKLVEVWQMLNFGKYFLNTIIVVIGAVICSVVFNGLLAYAFAIVKPWGYKFFYGLVLLSYMIPAITSMVPLYKSIVDLGLINTYIPLWFMYGANAFYLITFKNYFESLPPAIFEAAAMDRCGKWRTFFHVVIPLSKPIIGVVAIFTMTAAWSDFLLPYLVLYDDDMLTVMVKIYQLQNTMGSISGFGTDKLLMVLTISILPQIVIFAIFQRQITGSSAAGAIKE